MKDRTMPEEMRLKMHQETFQRLAQDLIDSAAHHGFIISIEQVPLQPLAMGHYHSRVHVRPARKPS